MKIKLLSIALLTIILTSCGAPTLDTSSVDAFKESSLKIKNSLEPVKKDEFTKAVQSIMFDGDGLESLFAAANDPTGLIPTELNGLNADEVIVLANKKEIQRTEERLTKTQAEAKELQDKQAAYESSIDNVRKMVTIVESSARNGGSRYLPQAIVDLKIKNVSDVPLSKAKFRVVLSTEGRAMPWKDSRLSIKFDGGLEKDETHDGSYAPYEWSNFEVPEGSTLKLTVLNLFDQNERPIAPEPLGEYEERELKSNLEAIDSLKNTLAKLNQKQGKG